MQFNTIQIAIMYIINTYLNKLWSLPFIISSIFGYKLNLITDKERVNNLLKDFKFKSFYSYNDENKRPLGWVISLSRLYIGVVENLNLIRGGEVKWIWLFCSDNFINNIENINKNNMKKKIVNKNISKKNNSLLKFLIGYGNYHNWNYRIRKLPFPVKAYDYQEKIINEMLDIYKKNKFLTCCLYGKVGVGKTCIGHLLAKKTESYLCNNFNPSQPGETLDNLYSYSDKSYQSPLIIIIDEFDKIIKDINESKIKNHKHIPIFVKDKQSWNNFLDSIERGQYPNTILILTSNISPDEINKLDPCYIRKGRVQYFREVFNNSDF
jgi:hypothetical protein